MNMLMSRHPRLYKYSFILIILAIAATTVLVAFYVQSQLTAKSDSNFKQDVQKITDELVENVQAYNSILYSGRALILSSQEVTQNEWSSFFTSQSASNQYPGVSTIFYVDVIAASQKSAFEQRLRKDPYFGSGFSVKSSNAQAQQYAVASLVYSNNDVKSSLGFDNYSTASRKATYDNAVATNKPTASPPVKLATGPLGFFMALPMYQADKQIDGFIAVSFRANDFVKAVIGDEHDKIAFSVTDVTDPAAPVVLHGSSNWDVLQEEMVEIKSLNVAGRSWEVTYKTKRSYDSPVINQLLPRLVLVTGALIMIVLVLVHSFHDRGKQIKKLKE